MHKVLGNKLAIFSLVLPGVLLFIFAVLAPIILSVYYATTDMTGAALTKVNYVGFANFREVLIHDSIFWKSIMNALLLGLGFIFLQHPVCIFMAIMLDKIGGKGEKIYRIMFFIPCAVSIVITAKMWVSFFNPTYGLLNKLLETIGLSALKMEWLSNPVTALPAVLFIMIWQGFGWGFLIYYSGLKGIPTDMYEAARIDGAEGLKLYTRITVPLLMPVIKMNVTLAIISALKQMETVYLTTNGGPGYQTQLIANYLYMKAFDSFQFGYGNAISVLFVLVCLIVTFMNNKFIKSGDLEY